MNGEILIGMLHFVFAFFLCICLTNWWIKVAKRNKLEGKDMNKFSKPKIPEAGGIAVIISIVLTIMLYIFFKTFVLHSLTHLVEILTLTITMLLACFIGFIDDILGWKKGLSGWQKILVTIPIAIPLMVINAGESTMTLPFFGPVNFGLFYPLVIVLLGIIGATNGYNLLAGYNGLEAGLGIIIFSTLGIISLVTKQFWLVLIAAIIIAALIGFLLFNKYPAKIFPGDSLTYSLGALIACFAILGNMERATVLLFVPFIIEGILKARSKFKAENFGLPQRDGTLKQPYKKIYSLTHAILFMLNKMKKKTTEQNIVAALYILQLFFAIIALFSLAL